MNRDLMTADEATPAPVATTDGDDQSELRDGFRNLLPLIVKRLAALPTLRGVLTRAVPLLGRDGVPAPESARLVACDPALTAKVLRVINSPLYGLRYRVSTLSHALAMIGPHVLRRITGGIRPLEVDEETAPDWTRLWRHGLATAHAARWIAVKTGYDLPDEAFTAGVIHDLGESVLLLYGPRAVRRARRYAAENDVSILVAEEHVFGVNHAQVGSMLAERWNLPRLLRGVIRHHHDAPKDEESSGKSRELIGIVAAADRLATAAGYGMDETATEALETLTVGSTLELTGAEVESIRVGIDRELDDTLELLGMPDLLARSLVPGVAEELPAPDLAPRRTLEDRVSELAGLLRDLRKIEDPDEILPESIRGLHERLGFDRVLYLESAAGGRRLSGRYYHDGTPVRIEMRDLDLDLESHPGLSKTREKARAALLRADEHPDSVLSLLGVREIVAAALTIHGTVDGLVLADGFFTDREPTSEDVAILEAFALGVGILVENRGLNRQTRRLRLLAEKDELMGINNRRSLMQLLEKEVERARVEDSPLTVVMIDVDHFKMWNDVHGHQAGDRILKSLAEVVEETSRESDVVGRYGGEEFLVVLRDTPQDAGIIYAERLRRAVEQLRKRLEVSHPDTALTLSMGVAQLAAEETIEELVRRVDQALYAAKRRGRDRVCASS